MIKGASVSGPASAMVVSKLQQGVWPTAFEYRAYLEEKGCGRAEAASRAISYAKEPEYDFTVEGAADDFIASLKSFSLPS
jgi:hypothetical protein